MVAAKRKKAFKGFLSFLLPVLSYEYRFSVRRLGSSSKREIIEIQSFLDYVTTVLHVDRNFVDYTYNESICLDLVPFDKDRFIKWKVITKNVDVGKVFELTALNSNDFKKKFFDCKRRIKKQYISILPEIIAAGFLKQIKIISIDLKDAYYECDSK